LARERREDKKAKSCEISSRPLHPSYAIVNKLFSSFQASTQALGTRKPVATILTGLHSSMHIALISWQRDTPHAYVLRQSGHFQDVKGAGR